jgi:hypothetical protein
MGMEKEDKAMNERRKFPRFAQHIYLKLFVCDPSMKPSRMTYFKARTLDISRGGLRIESPREFTPGSVVGFKPDNISSHNISGFGEVKWCRQSGTPDCFEFGIAFPEAIQFRT